MTTRTSDFFRGLELYLLGILLFVLPTLESPKQIALVLYLAVWIGRRFSLSALRRFRPDLVEISLLALIVAAIASTVANWPIPNGTKGIDDTLRFVLVFWCIYRAGYTETQYRALCLATTAGVVVGLAYGIVEIAQGTRPNLELHSAGVLTQSAIFVGTVLIMTLGVIVTRWLPRTRAPAWTTPLALWSATLIAMGAALVVMASRGALLAVGLSGLLIAVLVNNARLWLTGAVVALLLGLSGLVIVSTDSGGSLLASVKGRYASERLPVSNRERYENWRIALAQVEQGNALWLGIGPRNYGSINVKRLHFDPPLRLAEGKLNHAHNLFLTKLVEGGLIGLGAMFLFFGLVARALFVAWRGGDWYDWKWFAGFGALAVPVFAGSFNTPFFQEHAILAMVIMAIFMASRRQHGTRRARPKATT